MHISHEVFQQEAARSIIRSRSRREEEQRQLRLDRLTAAPFGIGVLVLLYWMTYSYPYAEDQWLGAIAFLLMLPLVLTRRES